MKPLKLLPVLAVTLALCSCMNDVTFSSDARCSLSFSQDTVSMDTVFTGVASASKGFIVYNRNDAGLRFSVMLSGGRSGVFRINLDGQGGTRMDGLEIEAGDSMFCFVSANIPESSAGTPFLESDSIAFLLESGTVQYVRLMACGQNAVRLRSYKVMSDETFTPALPYIVFDSLTVAENACLTMQPGTRLFFHDGACLDVAGRVVAAGSKDSMVVMRGDRLDEVLDGLPYDLTDARWLGIRLRGGSFENRFEYCDIHGGCYGILADSSASDRVKFTMHSSMLHTVAGNCIEATGSRIEVANSQITNPGLACADLAGGASDFTFCTLADLSLWRQGTCAVLLSDSRDDVAVPFESASFNSCIITGRHANEFSAGLPDTARYEIAHSLVMVSDTTGSHFRNVIFEDRRSELSGAANFTGNSRTGYGSVFTLDSLSHARGIADTVAVDWPLDLAGVPRPAVGADAGCYQYYQ